MNKDKLLSYLTERYNKSRLRLAEGFSMEASVKCHEAQLLIDLINSGEFDMGSSDD